MSNIIEVYPIAGKTANTAQAWQYDYGQILHVNGLELPASYKAEFSNTTRGDAIPTVQTTDEIVIPAQFLESGASVYVWLVVVDSDSRTTEYALIVPVAARAKPSDQEPAPEEQSEIDQAIAALNSGVSRVEGIADAIPDTINDALAAAKESGEFDGADGQDGISPTVTITEITGGHRITIIDKVHPNGQVVDVLDGANGRGIVSVEKTGTSGLTDTYTITYTSGDPTTFTVVNGKDGQDAISPEIAVVSIIGGHRITITDANGTHTVDVLDGDSGRGIVSVQKTGKAGLVDTYTITYTDSMTSTFTVTNGQNGTDGISPSITITDVTGGHRVTIMDAEGQHSFDVMNGEDAVQDVQVNGVSVLHDGVANVPTVDVANGVVPWSSIGGYGVYGSYGKVRIEQANSTQTRQGSVSTKAITPQNQHDSAFYGLAKAAGSDEKNSALPVGQYTVSAKSAISAMLSGSVSVSGTTPSITALPGIQYICGEVSTLDITLPASGCIDVLFTSGSTPTVLTITPPTGQTVKWANGFDPTVLEANTTYEINIKDGLGVAASWT